MQVDWDDEDCQNTIVKDIAPMIVLEDTPMSKLHFLFIMLNISQVNIVNQGAITGIISKLEFLKKRKEEAAIMKKEQRRLRIMNYFSQGAVGQFGNVFGLGKNKNADNANAARQPEVKEKLLTIDENNNNK